MSPLVKFHEKKAKNLSISLYGASKFGFHMKLEQGEWMK